MSPAHPPTRKGQTADGVNITLTHLLDIFFWDLLNREVTWLLPTPLLGVFGTYEKESMPALPIESGGWGLGFESELLEQFLVGVGDGWIHLSCQIIEKFPWGFYLVIHRCLM